MPVFLNEEVHTDWDHHSTSHHRLLVDMGLIRQPDNMANSWMDGGIKWWREHNNLKSVPRNILNTQ